MASREKFLSAVDEIIPWDHWVERIAPYYPSGKRGRPPRGIETMLRMYLMQIWLNLSDVGIEDAIYDSYAMRKFMGIDFLSEQVPDSTTLLHFRNLLEENGIGEQIFEDVAARLDAAGLMMHGGSIVDATIISAPSSTKNLEKKRDPEMHQTKKGVYWYFGMKIHAGVDTGSGYVHKITATSANVHDIDETAKLIRPDDEVVYGDAGCSGAAKRPEIVEDEHLRQVEFRTNLRPSGLKTSKTDRGINRDRKIESRMLSIFSSLIAGHMMQFRRFARKRPENKSHALQSGECFSHRQTSIRLQKSRLSWSDKKSESISYAVRRRQLVDVHQGRKGLEIFHRLIVPFWGEIRA